MHFFCDVSIFGFKKNERSSKINFPSAAFFFKILKTRVVAVFFGLFSVVAKGGGGRINAKTGGDKREEGEKREKRERHVSEGT